MKAPILVVDDNPTARLTMEALLKAKGHMVISASTGQDGLNILEKHPISLLFLDIEMPDMSGFDVLAKLKELKIKIPVLMLTAKNTLQDVKKSIQHGATDYVVKPIDPLILLGKLDRVLQNPTEIFELKLGDRNLQSEVLFSQPIKIIGLSELGLIVESHLDIVDEFHQHLTIQQIKFLDEIGIKNIQLKALSSRLKENGQYEIFFSFLGVSEAHLQMIRKFIKNDFIEKKAG